MLSLPYVYALNGWVIATLYIVIGAIAAIWSNRILAYNACLFQKKNYNDLVYLAWGKAGSNFLLVSILIYVFGSLCSYQIILTSLYQYVIEQAGVDTELARTKLYATYFAVPMAVLVLYPLSIMEDMSGLRYVSLFSLVALCYTALVFLVEAPKYYKHFATLPEAVSHSIYLDWNLFPGFAMVCFSYSCQIQLLPIYSELYKPSLPRMNKIIVRSTITNFIFYAIIAVSGFISQLSLTPAIAVERQTPDGKVDIPTLIACVGVSSCIIASYPVNVNPFRQSVFTQLFKKPKFTKVENLTFVFVLMLITTLISIFFPNVTSVLGLVGGLVAI